MQKLALILVLLCCFTSCKSTKRIADHSKKAERNVIVKDLPAELANTIVENAKTYNGVRYKFGGTTNAGMDCSGLVYTAFKKENVLLPRVSRDMSEKGVKVALKEVKKGDLLFFRTNKNKKEINHVGLVISSKVDRIEFIHSTTSKGVIISKLTEPYWYYAFIEARRIL